MKKEIIFLLILTGLILVSCNDEVDIKTSSQGDYVLYCIINSDTTFHTAYLSKSYDVSGLDPTENTTDPSLTGAEIKVIYNKGNYYFKDSSVARTDSSRYTDAFDFYYNNSLDVKSRTIYDTPDSISIVATLPNNKTLTASSNTIPTGDMRFSKYISEFPGEDTSNFFEFVWVFYSTKNSLDDYYFLPVLKIKYSVLKNGVSTTKTAKVYYMTYSLNDTDVPVYPTITKKNYISYNKQFVEDVFNSISEGDDNKSDYTIHSLSFSVIVMDEALAAYYSASNTFEDEFSVRVDAADVTNIKGGYGLFGVYGTKTKNITLTTTYIAQYGYKCGF